MQYITIKATVIQNFAKVLTLSPSCNGKTNVQGETHILVQKMDSEENTHNESERSFPVDFSDLKRRIYEKT